MDEKIALRKAILVTIAKHHGLTLDESQIIVELKSGGSLAERTELLAILDKCRASELHTLVCFDVDRLTRDVADLKTITSAFFKAELTLITQRGVYRFDRHFDTTLLQILAVLGEKERRSFSYRRKAANEQRTRGGQLSQGYAPYGYIWDKEAHCFRVHPTEYPIVEEIFRRSWTEGCLAIVTDLNARGVPPIGVRDGVPRRADAAPNWRQSVIFTLTANPIYTGYMVKREETDRDGRCRTLPLAQWIWSDAPLSTTDGDGNLIPLPHPVTRAEWEALQEVRAGRRQSGVTRSGLLTGLLFCCRGFQMSGRGRSYACFCKTFRTAHAGMHASRESVEGVVWRLVEEFAATIPKKTASKRKGENDGAGLEIERAGLRRSLREKEATMDELVRRASWYHTLPGYGPERHAAALEALGREAESLRKRLAEIAARLERPDARRANPLLSALLAPGALEDVREGGSLSDRQMALHAFVARIDLPERDGGRTAEVRVTFHDFDGRGGGVVRAEIPHPNKGAKRPAISESRRRRAEEAARADLPEKS